MGMVGFIISMSTEIVAARYVALFLQAGSYAGFIVFYSWISSSFPRPPAKRAVAIAMINAFSQIGNIAGSYVWSLPAHGFRGSYAITLAMFGTTIVGCFVFRTMLNRLNKELELKEVAYNGAGPDEDLAVDPNDEKLQLAKPDAIVMHPGPINRGVEIDSAVVDGKQAVILPQVTFGIAVRMAVMSIVAGTEA